MQKNDTILIDENIPIIDVILSDYHTVVRSAGRDISNQILKSSNAQYLICRSQTKVNQGLVEGTPISFIGTSTSGADHVDIDYLAAKGIKFSSAIGSNATSVAEYVIFAILHYCKINSINLDSKTMGIIGFGNIGKRLADFASQLGLKLLINDPPLHHAGFVFPSYVNYAEIDELFRNSDIISNHVPLTINSDFPTMNLINDNLLSQIRQNSLFIHSSRGGVVDEFSLLETKNALNLTLAVDVWTSEPNFNSQLARECMLATPHIAGYSYDGKLNGAKMMISALSDHTSIKYDLKLLNDAMSNDLKCELSKFALPKLYEELDLKRAFLRDNQIFASSFSEDEPGKSKMFDEIRRKYPIRREILKSSWDEIDNTTVA